MTKVGKQPKRNVGYRRNGREQIRKELDLMEITEQTSLKRIVYIKFQKLKENGMKNLK